MFIASSNLDSTLSCTHDLMKIGVDYYLENDIKKAEYMQRKLNALTVKAINIKNIENRPPCKVTF